MGKFYPLGEGPPPGDGNGGGGTGETLLPTLQAILDLLNYSIQAGLKHGHIEVISLASNGVTQQLYPDRKYVTFALIQNISIENVTVFTGSNQGVAPNGVLLNLSLGAGQAGGSLPVGNVDLSEFFFVRATAGVTLAVYYEL